MIELKGVTKTFDNGFKALDNIDLVIPEGSAFGLLGSNGAGKSTILRLLAGIYSQDSGEVLVDGGKVFNSPSVKRKIFFVNDETIQFTSSTLNEIKSFYKGFYPEFSEEAFERLNGVIKLPVDKKLSTFSKGMKRQAIVLIGLACRPDYLMLDEAFDGLDPTMRIIVKRMLVDAMLDRKMTAIISSHNLNEINEVCDTVALLHKGKILFNREVDSVKGNIHKYQCVFKSEITKDDLAGIEILHFEKNHSIYNIIAKGPSEEVTEVINRKQPVVLDVIPLTLEEIFIYEMEVLGYDFDGIDR